MLRRSGAWLDSAHDRVYVDQDSVASRTIFVDTTGYNATDFHLTPADKQKLFYDNARRILGLRDPSSNTQQGKREPALA